MRRFLVSTGYRPLTKERAKDLRRRTTPAEEALWQAIRNRRWPYRFRRQHPIGPFIADFLCFPLRLVVELDGSFHFDRREYDACRDAWFRARGYTVLRFSNGAVLGSLGNVLKSLERFISEWERRSSPTPPSPARPPAGFGEGGRSSEDGELGAGTTCKSRHRDERRG